MWVVDRKEELSGVAGRRGKRQRMGRGPMIRTC